MGCSGGFQYPRRDQSTQRLMNPLELLTGRQAGECAGKMRVPGTGEDVLKAVGLEQRLLDHTGLELGQPASAGSDKVIAVGSGLPLHNPVDCPDELDQLVNRHIARHIASASINAAPLQFVHDGVLALLLPVKEKDVLVEFRQPGILANA